MGLYITEGKRTSNRPAWRVTSGLRCTAAVAQCKLLNATGARITREFNPAS